MQCQAKRLKFFKLKYSSFVQPVAVTAKYYIKMYEYFYLSIIKIQPKTTLCDEKLSSGL